MTYYTYHLQIVKYWDGTLQYGNQFAFLIGDLGFRKLSELIYTYKNLTRLKCIDVKHSGRAAKHLTDYRIYTGTQCIQQAAKPGHLLKLIKQFSRYFV